MASPMCILGVLVLLLVSIWSTSADQGLGQVSEESKKMQGVDLDQDLYLDLNLDLEPDSGEVKKNSGEEDSLSVSERLEEANKQLDGDEDSMIEDGDIAVPRPHHVQKRNADPCVRKGCKWRRSCNGKVYVPYVIANHYSSAQLRTIRQAFTSFARKTCIRFVRRRKQRDYLYIHSSTGCWSFVGRRGHQQKVSLRKNGCIHLVIIQHELLHALGFHHEHKRSDRDRYVRVLWGNIETKFVHNFNKTNTVNLGTPYDYASILHYSSTAFSKNGKPTLVARRCNVTFGNARKMSVWDVRRVNRLYCRGNQSSTGLL